MWQPVLMIDGYILAIVGLSMFVPAALDMYDTGNGWSPFVTSALITLFVGLALFLANRVKINKISLKQGYLATCLCWFSAAFFSALPFLFSESAGSWPSANF